MPSSPHRRGLLTALLVAAAVPLASPGLARAAAPHDHRDAPPPRVVHRGDPVAVTTAASGARLRTDAVRVAVGVL